MAINQSVTAVSSKLTATDRKSSDLREKRTRASSAKRIKFMRGDELKRSLIQKKNGSVAHVGLLFG